MIAGPLNCLLRGGGGYPETGVVEDLTDSGDEDSDPIRTESRRRGRRLCPDRVSGTMGGIPPLRRGPWRF